MMAARRSPDYALRGVLVDRQAGMVRSRTASGKDLTLRFANPDEPAEWDAAIADAWAELDAKDPIQSGESLHLPRHLRLVV